MEIKVGRGKHATLDAEQAIAFVKEAYDYSGIDKLNVVIEDEDDKEVETNRFTEQCGKIHSTF